jgi:hypothetical protein
MASQRSVLLAPGASVRALSAPGRGAPLPAIDDHVLEEDCREELVEGHRYELMPAKEPHGTQHFDLPKVLGHVLHPDYKGSVDMLTRPSTRNDFAPDVSILPKARDPSTGGRLVEELIFEVKDTESWSHVTTKAKALLQRGMRRAFVLDVKDRSLHEWDPTRKDWTRLPDTAVLTDPCFLVPVPVAALIDDVLGEDAVARALLARGNREVLAAVHGAEARGEARGETRGKAEAVLSVLAARGVAVPAQVRDRVLGCSDLTALDRWIARAAVIPDAQALFAAE